MGVGAGGGDGVGAAASAAHRLWTARRAPHTDAGRPHRRRRRPFGTDPFGYAILAIGIISGAYTVEIFRSGIQSVDAGQLQAVRTARTPRSAAV